jgi:hypothetical protein
VDERDHVRAALDTLRAGLTPFIEAELRQQPGPPRPALASSGTTSGWPVADPDVPDVAALLNALLEHWHDVFRARLGPPERSLVYELRTARNAWAHQRPMAFDDVYRTLDSAERLLRAVGAAEQAAAIAGQKSELWRRRADAPSPPNPQAVPAGPVGAARPPAGSPGRPPMWRLLQEGLAAGGGRTTNVALRDWILERYPDANVQTIQAQITICTVNHPSRIHYPENRKPRADADPRYDFLYRPGRGQLERPREARPVGHRPRTRRGAHGRTDRGERQGWRRERAKRPRRLGPDRSSARRAARPRKGTSGSQTGGCGGSGRRRPGGP